MMWVGVKISSVRYQIDTQWKKLLYAFNAILGQSFLENLVTHEIEELNFWPNVSSGIIYCREAGYYSHERTHVPWA